MQEDVQHVQRVMTRDQERIDGGDIAEIMLRFKCLEQQSVIFLLDGISDEPFLI